VRRLPLDLRILFEDNHCLAVLKPAGMLVQPDRTGDRTIVDEACDALRARDQRPGNVYVSAVHRLDRPVSGVLLLARTSKAAERLSEQFRSGTVEKRYVALVEHPPVSPEGTLVHRLVKDREDNRVRIAPAGDPNARIARLDYRTLGPRAGGTLLQVLLHTGRAHQIRVQLAAAGCPIVGDLRYGARQPLGSMIALHAEELTFSHPTRGHRVTVRAPVPDAWGPLLGT
jgi:23S rRNA pseudouridine1911/1915/1917 synthase